MSPLPAQTGPDATLRRQSRPRLSGRGVLLAGAMALLTACGGGEEEINYVERPAEVIYQEAEAALARGNQELAAELFDEVERQHPYSPLATDAQLLAAYALYDAQEYDEAVIALDRFIALNPGNEDVDYAFYLRALCYYEQISDVERDQRMTELALDSLEEVIARFPDTDYGRDAVLKRDLTLDQLAGKEMNIGRWYLRQGHVNAAINRFTAVVQDYQTTTHVPEALHRLTESYVMLGLPDEAERVAAVLGYNYPGSDWYQDTYALLVDEGYRVPEERGLVRRTLDSLF